VSGGCALDRGGPQFNANHVNDGACKHLRAGFLSADDLSVYIIDLLLSAPEHLMSMKRLCSVVRAEVIHMWMRVSKRQSQRGAMQSQISALTIFRDVYVTASKSPRTWPYRLLIIRRRSIQAVSMIE